MNMQSNIIALNTATTAGINFPELTAKTDFTAGLDPIFDRGGDQIDSTIGRVVTRRDNGQALGVVGARYGVADNGPIYQMIKEGAEVALPREALKDIELTESASYGGQFTRIDLLFKGLGADIRQLSGSSTQLLFKIGLTNSFNGSGSIRLFSGAEDLWCTNGCTSAEYHKKAARHTSGFTPEIFAGFIEEQCEQFLTRVNTWRAWAQKTITPDQAEAVLNEAGMAGRKVKTMMEQFEREAAARGRTVWAMYSALTAYSSHADQFAVRNSGNVDNVAVTLDGREREVSRIVGSENFLRLAA